MVSAQSVDEQLKRIHYSRGGWNRSETEELASILLPEEEIFECVNGWYEGGFALLCATNIRVLLVDKKPFKYLTVEDTRFDTINQIDYFHRMFNASICITAGLKNLTFRSYNQPRLRKLISHVQLRMAALKQVDEAEKARQQNNLQDMDQQFKAYLLSQYEQHQNLRRQHETSASAPQTLATTATEPLAADPSAAIDPSKITSGVSVNELYEDGINEIFGKYHLAATSSPVTTSFDPLKLYVADKEEEVNPLKIAYSKLPLILSHRKTRSYIS